MSSVRLDTESFTRARTAMCTARENDYAVLEAVAGIDHIGTGYPSRERLLEDLLRIDRRDAKRLVRHAAALVPQVSLSGEPLAPRAPATARVSAAGDIGPGHVDVVLGALERLAHLPAEVVAEAEHALAEAATHLPPRALEKVADRLVATLDPDGVAPGEADLPADELHLGTRRDGPLNGTFRFHSPADRELVREVLDALSTPAGPDDPRSLATRQADAFLDLVAQAASPTGVAAEAGGTTEATTPSDVQHDDDGEGERTDDGSGGDGGRGPARVLGRATFTVTMDLEWLRGRTGHARLDSETAVSPADARRLACDAGIVPMILGSRGEPLDVARLTYTVPEGIRRALIVRDRGCAFPGCTRRPGRCAAHHIVHWADGGPTALHNLTLLCRYHHRLIHYDHWRVEMCDGRPRFVPPPWIDPTRRPRCNESPVCSR